MEPKQKPEMLKNGEQPESVVSVLIRVPSSANSWTFSESERCRSRRTNRFQQAVL